MQLVPLKKWQKRRLSKHKFRRFCTTHSNSPFVTHNIKKCCVVMNLSNLKLAVYHIFSLKLKPLDFLRSVNSNFTLTVHSPKLWQAKTHFGEKKEKIWLDQNLNPRSVDQKLTMPTITPLVPCKKIGKSIYVTYIVMRQKMSLGLSKFCWVYCQSKVRINWL